MNEDPSLLAVRELSKRFANGKWAFCDVSFQLAPGEFVCILGKSGAGKTSLLNCIAGAESATNGSIDFKSTLAYAPQSDLLLPWRTALENVLLPHEIRAAVDSTAIERARSLFHDVGLSGVLNLYPDTLSGGMRQRVSLVRALVQEAKLMLFDEPFSANDAHTRLLLAKVVRMIVKREGRSALFVTHSIEEAMALGDRVLTLSGSPGTVSSQVEISLRDEYRDPVAIRTWADHGRVFGELWQSLEGR